ncbi:hypothetical protein BX616_002647 [Lobosporangium transversale]|uniref:Endoplasmic reticulum junction formation protein lunapark n=1 Tax=Lobosporangium transversale TaxID=64571 RepID=A0A1Y2GRC0_9FUNG|nr:hypothetical protein BCR41DRAFT_351154 [Lobosporangium transversale]KAF9900260.1 hypothetical protein BX616_002647 [Lobosporangium transversale]ORZ20032.1 hypothetical protein BCR41DRAFT_351154 [Lobosporangium transversale]|eukprot:XP_021882572.1 hypothetical protein BCR41DRAFT_351154 [Lobosporangium transversale]
MGGIISRLRQSNDSDYEKILSDLDSNIRKAELRLSAIHVRERRLLGHWMTYSIFIWILYTAVFALYLHQKYQNDPQFWALSLSPVLLGLPIFFVGRFLITVWYKRAKSNEEIQLNLLRADQRLKVEELKKKTAYYSTKTLLERYDPASQRSASQKSVGLDGKPVPALQNGQSRPHQTNMMDPGLRQRQGPGVANTQGMPMNQGRQLGVSSGVQQQHHQQPPHMGPGPQSGPRGPQGIQGPQMHQFNPAHTHSNGGRSPPYAPPSTERHWYDKIVDVIVGDEGPDTKYALICGQCYAHNGLALPQEIEDIQYVCPKCNFFNPSRRKARLAAQGLQPPSTPEQTLLRAQGMPLPLSRDPSPAPTGRRSPHLANHSRQDEFNVENNGPERVPNLQLNEDHVNRSGSEDNGFVNNWNDSDVEGVSHNEDDGEAEEEVNDSAKAQGYDIGAEEEEEEVSEVVPKKIGTKKTESGITTRAAAAATRKKKSKRA